jgi:hypothetical protein
MANPSTLSIGTRITFTAGFVSGGPPLNPVQGVVGPVSVPASGGQTPALVFGLVPEIAGMVTNQNTPLPGLCQSVVGAAPDFIGSTAVVHDLAGKPWLVTLGLNQTSWVSAGSPAAQRRWNYIDLTF